MALGNLSISRVDGPRPIRPRNAEPALDRTGERSRPDKAKESQSSAGTRGAVTLGAERTKLRTRQSEEGSLTLTTAEGDKVTISFSNKQSTKVDQAKLYGPNGSFEATRTRSKETSQLSVSLEGELSEAELKDITDLVSKLSSGLESARSGDFDAAQKQVASTGNLGTIQNYSFAYQQSSNYSFKSTQLSVTA